MATVTRVKHVRGIGTGTSATGLDEFEVTGAASCEAALAAVVAVPTTIGQLFDVGSTLKLQTIEPPEPKSKGFMYIVRCNYAVPGATAFKETQPTSIKRSWNNSPASAPIDRDIYGNVILNGGLFPPTEPPTKNFIRKKLVFKGSVPNYDLDNFYGYENKVNSVPIVITEPNGHSITVAAGHMFCESITTDGEYDQFSTVVPILFNFELQARNDYTNHPYQERQLQQSLTGWYYEDSIYKNGPFYYIGKSSAKETEAEQCSTPILIDEVGQPLDGRIRIRMQNVSADGKSISWTNYTPHPNPTGAAPTGAIVEKVPATGTPKAVWFVWMKYPEVDFTTLSGLPFAHVAP